MTERASWKTIPLTDELGKSIFQQAEYIVRLVGKVVTVSVETVNLVKELEQAILQEDWMNKTEVKAPSTYSKEIFG